MSSSSMANRLALIWAKTFSTGASVQLYLLRNANFSRRFDDQRTNRSDLWIGAQSIRKIVLSAKSISSFSRRSNRYLKKRTTAGVLFFSWCMEKQQRPRVEMATVRLIRFFSCRPETCPGSDFLNQPFLVTCMLVMAD